MKVCEVCGGHGSQPKGYHGQTIRVQCGTCLGTGMLNLGHESESRYHEMRQAALARAIREGWYEVAWEGEPGHAQKVLRLIGRADLVQRSA